MLLDTLESTEASSKEPSECLRMFFQGVVDYVSPLREMIVWGFSPCFPFVTVQTLQSNLHQVPTLLRVSTQIVRNLISHAGFRSRLPAALNLLSHHQRQVRLNWARQRSRWWDCKSAAPWCLLGVVYSFMRSSANCHRANTVSGEMGVSSIKCLPWHPCSPDLKTN